MKTYTPTFIFCFVLTCASFIAVAQSPVEYFEVYTKLAHSQPGGGFSFNRDSILARINNVPDTASTIATFVFSANDPALVDSVFLTLTDSRGTVVYTAAHKKSTLQTNTAFKVNGKTMYLTVGPYAYLKRFNATVKLRDTSGHVTAVKSFAKN